MFTLAEQKGDTNSSKKELSSNKSQAASGGKPDSASSTESYGCLSHRYFLF